MQKAKVKGHSIQKLEWKQTRLTDAAALPPVLTWSVNIIIQED